MRFLFFVCLAALFSGCNSSSTNKESDKETGDTTQVIQKPFSVSTKSFTGAEKLAFTEIPASFHIKGAVSEAWKWNDSLGENILVLSQVAPFNEKQKDQNDDEGQTASLHVLHFIKAYDKFYFAWGLNDEEKDCPFDITCSFIPGSTTITDLNKNGYAEIKLQYRMSCRSDVSPSQMKLFIRENGMNYGLTGESWIELSPGFKFDINENNVNLELTPRLKDEMAEMLRRMGRYESERQFKKAPPEFLNYARSEWIKFVKESFE